jgi:hypothetical protein
LIVKNGNVFIKNDLNTNWKVLWIIVLKDNYNVNTDYNQAWNVYIAKNVENINAVIYADGALRSAKVNWNEYEDAELQKTLDIKWSVFSRNTIWWATKLAWKNYLLPWGKSTTLNLAEKYDLNYIRKVSLCNLDDYSVKITYDSRIQTNPPKGFSK